METMSWENDLWSVVCVGRSMAEANGRESGQRALSCRILRARSFLSEHLRKALLKPVGKLGKRGNRTAEHLR